VRQVARLLAAIALWAGAGNAATAAPPAAPPSVFEERAAGPASAAQSDPTLRQRFLSGKNAEVCQEATRNKLYGTRKIGLDYYFVGR
jgi:hypothetical protein